MHGDTTINQNFLKFSTVPADFQSKIISRQGDNCDMFF